VNRRVMIKIQWPTLDRSVRAALMLDENPHIAEKVLAQLPMDSMMGHVVISGETMWFPTKILHLGPNQMVKRAIGDLYFFGSGQSVCMTYGTITESAKVNKFGEVLAEDIPILQSVGREVLQRTIYNAHHENIPVHVSLLESEADHE